ncbi:MAG: type I glyceraldehyde-3-phosphate dehydrogenase [Candidatus Pacebacteria bacterium]|nr:type I glyceraldehyde-3-phosphate dehydrogenase [Candidatus Paceibacterota bacterium]
MKLAINGFGRIGRTSFRVWFDKHQDKADLLAVNTSGSMDLDGWAYLLKYDSNYGVWTTNIAVEMYQRKDQISDQDPLLGYLLIGSKRIAVFAQKDPSKLPWLRLGIDTVIESTGVFTTKEKTSAHLTAGAKRVVISAPPKGDGIGTFVVGVNEAVGAGVESNASCTTNCVAPVTAVIHGALHVKKAMMCTIHSYTDDQNLQDNSHKDLRRARSAAKNIVPTTTGAAQSVAETIPELKGLFDGISYRVPTSTGSIAEIVFIVEKKTSVEEVKQILEQASQQAKWKGILAITHDPIVSSDIIGRSESSIVDLALTQVVDGDMVKVVAWYDNEWGYCNRLVEQAIK